MRQLPRGESIVGLEQMFGLDVRKRSMVFALSPERSGIRAGFVIHCVRSLTMVKVSASRSAGLVILEE